MVISSTYALFDIPTLATVTLTRCRNINFRTLLTELNPNFYIGGENVAFWGPMGWAIIFGLSFATFLTLVVVPILYYLINKIRTKPLNVAM